MADSKDAYFEQDNLTGCAPEDVTETDLRLIIKPISERRMKMLKDFKIESDEDYKELGEMFPEDE